MAWVIDHFKSLVDEWKHHLGNYFHKECAWYVYSIFLQQELDTGKVEWSDHYIRKSKKSQISGIPDELFLTPQLQVHVNCFKEVSLEEINTLLQEYENRYRKTFSMMLRKYQTITTQLWLSILITLFKKINWTTLHVTGRKQKLCSKQL